MHRVPERQRGLAQHPQDVLDTTTYTDAEDLIEDPEAAARHAVCDQRPPRRAVDDASFLAETVGRSRLLHRCRLPQRHAGTVAAYTYFSPIGRSDGRPCRRGLPPAHARCEHIEAPMHRFGSGSDARGCACRRLPSLRRCSASFSVARSGRNCWSEPRRTAIFNGDGGDSGFCSVSIGYAVSEYLRIHGVAPRLFKLASEVALLTEKSSWTVLTTAVRRARHRQGPASRPHAFSRASQLVSPELQTGLSRSSRPLSHPWFEGQRRVPWDKIRRLGILMMAPENYTVTAAADAPVPEIVSPLYSQPAIEVLLRIPIHTHFHRGRDPGPRAHGVRDGCSGTDSATLVERSRAGLSRSAARARAPVLKEALLDGVLARHGLLNRPLLEEVLSARPTKNTVLSRRDLSSPGFRVLGASLAHFEALG